MNRRDTIKAITGGMLAGVLGTTLPDSMAAGPMGGSGGCGGGSVVDPPIGATFRDPVEMGNLITEPGVVEVNLDVRIAPINVNGVTANLMTYNGCYPAPTIRVEPGDTLRVHLKNSLPPTTATNMLGFVRNFTNLHTHGWHVSPKKPPDDSPPADFVMYELPPGQTYEHVYDTSLQEPGTLCFYHPHKHGLVAEQYWAGLVGALITEDETTLLDGFETHLMILKDITLSGGAPAPHSMMSDYMQGKEGNVVMVNGLVNPRLYTRPGQVQRWRILNASNARFYRLGLEGHGFYLIGTDGGLLDKPYLVSELLLSPGERVDVLVSAPLSTGNYRLRALPYSRMGMMQSPTITLLTMTYAGKRLSPVQAPPAAINPNAARIDPSSVMIAAERTFTLSMGMGRGYINGQDFDVNPYMFMSSVGTFERWTIVNASNMDHPFHQHVNPGQVLSVTGGSNLYATLPAWKDVVLVPKGGSATMLVPVMDYDGMAMFHCHILEHEDIGMMGMWDMMMMMMM